MLRCVKRGLKKTHKDVEMCVFFLKDSYAHIGMKIKVVKK